jgi:hypothetical protein
MRLRRDDWKGEKVLIVESWDAAPHLETSLEIALRLAESGAEVDYRYLGGGLHDAEVNMGLHPLLRKAFWKSGEVE